MSRWNRDFKMLNQASSADQRRAFTLVELLVSMVILAILMSLLLQTLFVAQDVWIKARIRVEQYSEARLAFEAITRRLSLATLNSSWDYDSPVSPTRYVRQSDLHFVTGPATRSTGTTGLIQSPDTCGHAVFFQAPLGLEASDTGSSGAASTHNMEELLNGWGYYVQYRSDLADRPDFLRKDTARHPDRMTFSLMEFRQPSESLPLFLQGTGTATTAAPPLILSQTDTTGLYRWFREGKLNTTQPPVTCDLATGSRVLASNILALIISPRVPAETADNDSDYDIAPNYYYDSREWQLSSKTNIGMERNGITIHAATRNQLPPVLDVTLVALDGKAWQGFLEERGESIRYVNYMKEKFLSVGALTGRSSPDFAKAFREDLEGLKKMLTSDHIGHRIFSTSIAMRSAKWTSDYALPASAP